MDGPAVTLAGDTTAKPTVAVPFYAKTTDTAPLPAAVAGPAHIKLVVTALDGSTSETTVALTIQTDAVAIDAGSRHRIGTELRITGTSALAGSTGVLTPATSVVIYDMTKRYRGEDRHRTGRHPRRLVLQGQARTDQADHQGHGPVHSGRHGNVSHRHPLIRTG